MISGFEIANFAGTNAAIISVNAIAATSSVAKMKPKTETSAGLSFFWSIAVAFGVTKERRVR